MKIVIDDLTSSQVKALLAEHLQEMNQTSPPESKHALDIEGLKELGVRFWSIWKSDKLAGFIALKELSVKHAELKSMRTAHNFRNQGVASKLLNHIIDEAKNSGYRRLSLETGTMAYFETARCLYKKFGFTECQPFADYTEDPNSVFMTREL